MKFSFFCGKWREKTPNNLLLPLLELEKNVSATVLAIRRYTPFPRVTLCFLLYFSPIFARFYIKSYTNSSNRLVEALDLSKTRVVRTLYTGTYVSQLFRSTRGVQWETRLVGVQHRLLLGINTSPNDGIAASRLKESTGDEVGGSGRVGAITTTTDSTATTATCSSTRATKGANRRGPFGGGAGAAMNARGVCSSRRRYMYRLVAEVTDLSERVRRQRHDNDQEFVIISQ